MKLPLFLLVLTACAPSAPPLTQARAMKPIEHDLVAYVREDAHKLQLADLRATGPGPDLEVRLWSGFGLTGVDLLRIERTGDRWAATQYHLRSSVPAAGKSVADSVNWRSRWKAAERAGVTELTPVPVRRISQPIDDGFSLVIEVRVGERYWNAGADNPEIFCSADDQRLIAVANALLGRSLACRE